MQEHKFIYNQEFTLECGKLLKRIEITYHTLGQINSKGNNVIWVCHALTANSDVSDWWGGMIGKGKIFDPKNYFIICANILGSCYGSTGPLSKDPETGSPYYRDFPEITTRDIVKAHDLLRQYLGIDKIHTVIGGSIGGHQALEWSISNPELFSHLVIIATNARYTPWAIAFDESQRLAIEADPSFFSDTPEGGRAGLKAARSIALLSYRNYYTYNRSQKETDLNKTANFKVSTYQSYQGDKLVARFNAYSYYVITKIADSHNVGRNRGSVEIALAGIKAKTLVIGITSDILFPPEEQKFIANFIDNANYIEIDSSYGHDGFLIETEKLTNALHGFYDEVNVGSSGFISTILV